MGVRRVGRGGVSVVYVAEQELIEREVDATRTDLSEDTSLYGSGGGVGGTFQTSS